MPHITVAEPAFICVASMHKAITGRDMRSAAQKNYDHIHTARGL